MTASLHSLYLITIDDAINQIDIENVFGLPATSAVHGEESSDDELKQFNLFWHVHSIQPLNFLTADLLQWIAEHHEVTYLLHYLDDFLIPQSSACQHNLDILKHLCRRLGVSLAEESVRPHNLSSHHPGYSIIAMEVCLPDDK